MATSDTDVQKWVAGLLGALDERPQARQKPLPVLRAVRAHALTTRLKGDLAEHLTRAGINAQPEPAAWTRSTPWVVFRKSSAGSDFQLVFRSEKELSDFIVQNWQRIPFLAGFSRCEAQHRLEGGRLVCDLLFTRPRKRGFVVVELKKGEPGYESVTELFGYVAALKAKHAETPIEAWLVSGRPNEDLVDDLDAMADKHEVIARWFTYGVAFELKGLR